MTSNTIESFLQGFAKKFYMTEDVDHRAFAKLSDRERRENAAQMMIHEHREVSAMNESVFTAINEFAEFKSANSFNSIYFDKVRQSGGDVTKTPNFANSQVLINYSLATAEKSNTDFAKCFIGKMQILSDAASNLSKYKGKFEAAIKEEATKGVEDSKRVATQYYVNTVMQLDIGVDVLYSTSIRATFDHSNKQSVVKDMAFECQPKVLEELLTNLHYFNSLAATGKLNEILKPLNVEALDSAASRSVNENVLDVAFGLLLTNKVFDLLLFPIYALRFAVYAVKYIMAMYGKLVFSHEKSVAMMRSAHVTQNEFNAYKADAAHKELIVDQATRKAASDVSREVAEQRVSAPAHSAGAGAVLM